MGVNVFPTSKAYQWLKIPAFNSKFHFWGCMLFLRGDSGEVCYYVHTDETSTWM